MAENTQAEGWMINSADLPALCRNGALHAARMLRTEIADQARVLSAEGFIVPAPEAVQTAAEVFDHVSSLPGGEPWLQRPDPLESLGVICAFANAVDGLESELDMAAFDAWWQWRESAAYVGQALATRAFLNTGALDRAVEMLVADIIRAESDYGANR